MEEVIKGNNIFITGSPGTGKSFLIRQIIDYFKSTKKILITSTTGISALNIDGQTLHSLIPLHYNESTDYIIKKIKNKKVLINADILIIDEVSMLSRIMFKRTHLIFQKIRKNLNFFGGIQVILSGDFCQLKPIDGDYCFKSSIFKKITIVNLTENKRQKDDPYFFKLLERARFDKLTKKDIKIFNSMIEIIDNKKIIKLINKGYIALLPTNKKVDFINSEMFSLIEGEIKCYSIEYVGKDAEKFIKSTHLKNVKLKVGCNVIVIVNYQYGIANGTRGVVLKLNDDSVIVLIKNIEVEIKMFTRTSGTGYVSFMPLKLCYAITVHKSQGLTLNKAIIDLGESNFTHGQGYVALSRLRKLKDIKLISFDKNVFKQDTEVKDFYDSILD